MRNESEWRPTKVECVDTRWRASRDLRQVGRGSRYILDLYAPTYARIIQEIAGGVLLDLGCGKVPYYNMYRARVEEVMCVDWADSYHDSPHLDHLVDLNGAIPLPDASADTILATDVLEHIARPDILWSEISRLLRPGGVVFVAVPFLYWVHEAPHDNFRYTEFRLRRYCEDNGLAVELLEPYGGVAEVLADLSAKLISNQRLLSRLHLALCGTFSRSRIGRRLRERTARKFPLGYCLVARKPPGRESVE